MKKVVLCAIGAMIMMPAAAFAADDTAAAKEGAQKDPGDRWVCKTERMTGSLTRAKRTCMKASEWDKLANETSNATNKFVSESQRPDRVAGNAQSGF